ncbi:MAG: glycosyltransferase family 2 protein [Lachnospiraceae bacterium]|nr:glycosyltransferase family 2 protein [Lachnospiraceae bacterium]
MSNWGLVSVVIPMYNVEKYIEKCLASLRSQTYKDLEIICVNDGSTDNTLSLAQKCAREDERIILVDQPNGGPSSARNAGIDAAKGDYIYFLDGDDWLETEAIEALVNCAQENQAELVLFNARTYFESGEVEAANKSYTDYYSRKGTYEGVYTGENLFVELNRNWDFKPSACLVFIKREFLQEIGLRFYEGILHEDNLFTITLLQKAERAVLCNKVLYWRLLRKASIMSGGKNWKHAYGLYVCRCEILRVFGEKKFSFAYYKALKKYLDVMQAESLKAVRGSSYEELLETVQKQNPETAGGFLEYVSKAFEMEERSEKKVVRKDTKQIQKEKKRVHKKKTGKRWGNRIAGLPLVKKIKWYVKTIWNMGPGYFIYRKKLKVHKDKICVSIVMPVYNAKPYIREALDCLVKQNLPNIEVICVDDGSTDGSYSILQEYAETDKRFRVFRQENQGAGAARNKGLEMAVGEYLLFLDADDIFHENMCNQMYYLCKKRKADVGIFAAKRIDMQSGKTENMNWVLQPTLLPLKKVFAGEDISEKLFQLTTGCAWNKMLRREFVEENGLRFQSLQNANDTFFVRLHLALAKRITVTKDRLITYRYNSGTNIQANKDKAPLAFHEAFRAIREELEKRELFSVYERTFCNMALKESLHNLKTTKGEEAQDRIRDMLKKEGNIIYGFQNHEKTYYYDSGAYEEMHKILRIE